MPESFNESRGTTLSRRDTNNQVIAPPSTPQSRGEVAPATSSTPNYLNEARQRFYATMAERERLIGERKALADSLMQIQQQRTDKALAIANLGTEVGIENIVRERQFQEGKKARLQDLENMYAQHAAKYGMALNRQAIEILKEFSNINAPTLTSIMTGYEMARTSAMENDARRLENFTKLNESYNAIQKELLASNQREAELNQQLRINKEQAELDMLDYKIKSKAEELDNMLSQNKELANGWEGWGRIEAGLAATQNRNANEANSFSMRDLSPTDGEATGKSALTSKEIAIRLGDADSRISGSALVLPEEFTSAYEQNLATYVKGTGSSLEKVLKDPNALKKVYNFTFDDFLKNKKIVPVEGSDNKFFKFNITNEEGKGTEGGKSEGVLKGAEVKRGKHEIELSKRLQKRAEIESPSISDSGLSETNVYSESNPYYQRMTEALTGEDKRRVLPLYGNNALFEHWWKKLNPNKTFTINELDAFEGLSSDEQARVLIEMDDQINKQNTRSSYNQPPLEDVTDLEALYA